MFTLNFNKEAPDLIPNFSKPGSKVGFAVWQHEKISHNHLQGYIQFLQPFRRKAVVDLLGGRAHVEPAVSRHNTCVEYCTKPRSRISGPYYYGVPVQERSNKRTAIEQFRQSPERLMMEDPNRFRRISSYLTNLEFMNNPIADIPKKDWMLQLDSYLSKPPDRRTIYWVYGPKGSDGKTYYATSLLKKGWFYTKGGSKDNVIYQYVSNVDRSVVVDIPRESFEYIQYNLLEMFKDRLLISNKYEPISSYSDKPVHLVVMANFLPDFSKISVDRVVLINC